MHKEQTVKKKNDNQLQLNNLQHNFSKYNFSPPKTGSLWVKHDANCIKQYDINTMKKITDILTMHILHFLK